MCYIDEHNTWKHSLVSSRFCITFKTNIHMFMATFIFHMILCIYLNILNANSFFSE